MLAIAGGKGGCGKTTTTLGVARALDGHVLAVDADRDMPNLHALAGVPREPTVADVGGVADDPLSIAHESSPGLSVLPAASGGPGSDTGSQLERVKSTETTTLVDCPAGAGPDAAGPLRVADAVLLVSTLCAPALRDTAKTAAMARALGTRVVGVVLNRTRLAPAGVSELLDCPVLGTVPEHAESTRRTDGGHAAYVRVAKELSREQDIL
ncbi:CDP-4-keto-6-deoxy-D-glucose-3-dehydrase [Haloprofundus marisrubri]|uniref:CDP-4-keto-6-deoxy-D-glucose-3-dehydrase n=1 Tax=Haloprofundus marisrubri TaxID=1514971 RepID=A0A0W1RF99_9EURY|nr:CDP-4-keto-6-deoxy-D-glucose-3-dehydrase [Haloprofundus marisrubri]KTG11291.1 CDP-4-keto-6-deoxy-D-glucose-3-dehydrase [Haloprofundus marisrubri]